MEGRLPCNAFFKLRGCKYPIHIDRRGKWWRLDGYPIVKTSAGEPTISSSVAEVDEPPAWALHDLNMDFIQREAVARVRERRHAEEERRMARWERLRGRVLDDL